MPFSKIRMTRWEVEVLREYLITGHIPAAAERLCISTHAANRRLSRLRKRIGLKSVTQLVALAIYSGQLGEIPEELEEMCRIGLEASERATDGPRTTPRWARRPAGSVGKFAEAGSRA